MQVLERDERGRNIKNAIILITIFPRNGMSDDDDDAAAAAGCSSI